MKNPHRLRKARHLLARVESLLRTDDVSPVSIRFVIGYARQRGAHSVARALSLLERPDALDRHGIVVLRTWVRAAAKRWMRRVEEEALEAWPDRKAPPDHEGSGGAGRNGHRNTSPERGRDSAFSTAPTPPPAVTDRETREDLDVK